VPKVEIKLLKISHVRILFLVSLLCVAVINPYLVFKFLIFKNSSLFIFIVYLLTWQSSWIITNYNWKKSKKFICLTMYFCYFEAYNVKKHIQNHHTYCRQGCVLYLCSYVQAAVFVWCNQKMWQFIKIFFESFSPFYKRLEDKGKKWKIKERPCVEQWINILQCNSFV